ncbi:hypothetical protein CRG98_049560, partial [Punica granatum]
MPGLSTLGPMLAGLVGRPGIALLPPARAVPPVPATATPPLNISCPLASVVFRQSGPSDGRKTR